MSIKTLNDLSIPKEQDVIFVSPESSGWFGLLEQNRSLCEGLPNRRESRERLLETARNYTQRINDGVCPKGIGENIVASGHQPVWYHCGVWAKDLTACRFARAANGTAVHLVLDHDVCDTALLLPEKGEQGNFYFRSIEVEPGQQNVPLELRPPCSGPQLRRFVRTVIDAHQECICSDVWPECAVIDESEMSRFESMADLITYLQAVLHAALGLEMLYLPVSKLSESDVFLDFVVSTISQAGAFAGCYNDAIAAKADRHKMKPRKVIKRLAFDEAAGLIELPFWLVSPGGVRTSLHVSSPTSDTVIIGAASTELGQLDTKSPDCQADRLKGMLRRHRYLLRPKAVSLTLFARLFLADLFVHGVGASSYEPVTDYIIEHFYKVKPPEFTVATCTARPPLARSDTAAQSDISELRQKVHRLKHNPEEYIAESVLAGEEAASLLRSKKELIARATDPAEPADVRRSAWNSLSIINNKLYEYARETAEALEKKGLEAEKFRISEKVLSCREFFFGLFPEERLRKIAASAVFG
jgi:hypothetical protein